LVRASGSYPLCQGFKSLHRHHPPAASPAPFAASVPAASPAMDLLEALAAFFFSHPSVTARREPSGESPPGKAARPPTPALDRGDRVVVAFSGGADSTALLWGLARLAPVWGIELVAAHLDHAMDPGSRARAASAGALARRLRVPLVAARREIALGRAAGESLEAAARRVRYDFLEEVRRAARARWVATAHHRDDQAETVLLRLRFGTGVRGLAGIQPRAGAVVRPLLSLPRATLRAAVAAAGLPAADDPGNRDPRQPRSRIRHQVLPALARAEAAAANRTVERGGPSKPVGPSKPGEPVGPSEPAGEPAEAIEADLAAGLARLAARAARALPALDRRLAREIGLRPGPAAAAAAAAHGSLLAALPPPLLPHALALLHRRAGAPHPASRAAVGELGRQLRAAPAALRVACDCGAGWRWQRRDELLWLAPAPPAEAEEVTPFTYTLEVPGELTLPELAVTIRVSEAPVEDWMLRGAPRRAGLALPPAGRGSWTVRNRRPGDRLWPLGSPGSRKLKAVLIDRGVPSRQRDRLPLLCWAGEIAWVPGVTIDHRFRLTGRSALCLCAEVLDAVAEPAGNPSQGRPVREAEGMFAPSGRQAAGDAGRLSSHGAPREVAEL
jgi:tRNA(Ile)-lysidine synthase